MSKESTSTDKTEVKKKQTEIVRKYSAGRIKTNCSCPMDSDQKELTEAELNEMGYGQGRAGEHDFAQNGSTVQKKTKFILKNKATGKVISIHQDAPAAVMARNKIGSFTTHAIIKEQTVDERIDMPQGHKYSADPITAASSEGKGRKKPQMGTKTNTAAVVAAILNKTKE